APAGPVVGADDAAIPGPRALRSFCSACATRRSRRAQADLGAASPMTPSITYYRVADPTISFGIVAKHHVFWLRKLGFDVVERTLYFGPDELSHTEPSTPIAVVNTLFDFYSWGGLSFDDVV